MRLIRSSAIAATVLFGLAVGSCKERSSGERDGAGATAVVQAPDQSTQVQPSTVSFPPDVMALSDYAELKTTAAKLSTSFPSASPIIRSSADGTTFLNLASGAPTTGTILENVWLRGRVGNG